MAKRVVDGFPWLRWGKPFPRLVLHEKHEEKIRWSLRILTAVGIITSLITLPILVGFSLAIGLVVLDVFLEKTIFYYTSLYVTALPDFRYEPDKWPAMVFVSFGPPSPESDKVVGLVFSDRDYARKFFDLLRAWNHGSSEDTDNNIQLSFITDEDRYYVYLYPSIEKKSIKKTFAKVKRQNRLKKFGKEHFGLVMQMVICRGFDTSQGYGLGQFTDNHLNRKHFLLGPFISEAGNPPQPIMEIEPISKFHYKAKIPGELTDEDFEYIHWRKLVKR